MNVDPSNQFQIAAVMFTLIILVVTLELETIEGKGWQYRAIVGVLSMLAVIPAFIAVGLSVFGGFLAFQPSSLLSYVVVALAGVLLLVIDTMVTELFYGLKNEDDWKKLLAVLGFGIGLIFILLSQI